MAGPMLWGLGVAVLNVMYSFVYLGISISDLYIVDQDGNPFASYRTPWMWIIVYACNAVLNTYLFLRILKSDLIATIVWFFLTCLLFLFRVFGVDYANMGSTYKTVTIVVNVYIFISFIIMAIAAKKLANSKEASINNPTETRTERSVSSPGDETIAWNANESIRFISQTNCETINARSDNPARLVEHMATNDDFFYICCDNVSCGGDNQSGGGCDGECDGGGCDGGGDGGGCDGGGDGGGCDGGGDGGGCDGGADEGGYDVGGDGGGWDGGGDDCGGGFDD